jgi:hypothetical protein
MLLAFRRMTAGGQMAIDSSNRESSARAARRRFPWIPGALSDPDAVVGHLQAGSGMSTRYNDGSQGENDRRAFQLHDGSAHKCHPADGPEGPMYLTDSNSLWDQLRGQTTEHADPPRFEDEGQSGG